MSSDVGMYHCFGILLSDLCALDGFTKLAGVAREAAASAEHLESMEEIDDFAEAAGVTGADNGVAAYIKIVGPVLENIVCLLEALGIEVSKDAMLIWTGSGDDRPGRCEAPIDEVILGFWLNDHDPTEPIAMSDEFLKRSHHYSWVWGG